MIKTVNGAEISYERKGNGGDKVLLLHGWGCDGTLMFPVARELEDFDVLIPDLPGHGKSGRPPEPWGVPEYASCVLQLLKDEDFIPCHVIAHSFGCRIAAWIAASEPAAFEKIIFTGAAGIRPKPDPENQKRSSRYKKMKRIAETVRKMPFLGFAGVRMEEKLRQKYGSRDYNALDEEMRKTFVKVVNQDLTELYSRFQSSTLLIWGTEDTETPIRMAEEMEKRIPDAALIRLEGGSHFAYMEQIMYFNRIVRQFLKGGD